MTTPLDPGNSFEQHPDVLALQAPRGLHETTLQAKLELFESCRILARLADVPVNHTLRFTALSADGTEEITNFRKLAESNDQGSTNGQWVLLKQVNGDVEEVPVNMFGACASPWGTMQEPGPALTVRQYAHFAYAVVYPVRFRDGSEVPGTPYAKYTTPEQYLTPSVLAQHLMTGYVFYGTDGLLYWNEIDQSKSGERITGQVLTAEVILAGQST